MRVYNLGTMDHLVYLMGEAGTSFVKVGRTGQLSQRRASIQSGNPRGIIIHFTKTFPSERDAERFEKDVHAAFAGYRRLGEWFDDSETVIFNYFQENTERFVLAPPGRPVERDENDDRTHVEPRVIAALKSLARKSGARLSARTIQEKLKCTRAVARHLASNLPRYLK